MSNLSREVLREPKWIQRNDSCRVPFLQNTTMHNPPN